METLREHVVGKLRELMPPQTSQKELEEIADQALWDAIEDKKSFRKEVRIKWVTTT